MAEEVMTRREACAYLKISFPTLERWIRAGQIPIVKLGRRVLLHRASIDALLQAHASHRSPAEAPEVRP